MAAKTKAWREADPKRAKESQKAAKERNPERWYEKERARTQKYKGANREKVREAAVKYHRENPEVATRHYQANREKVIARSAEWAKKNPEKSRVLSLKAANKRRAAKLKATPKWADLDEIGYIYEMSVKINILTGVEFHVDHEIPLQGKNVCGLHVADNLRIIEAKENLSKGNKFDHDITL